MLIPYVPKKDQTNIKYRKTLSDEYISEKGHATIELCELVKMRNDHTWN